MVNFNKIERLVRNLRKYITHLKDLGNLGSEDILADPYKQGAARYYLQVAFESCIDLGNHVIASEQLQAPSTHRETFQILNEAGIIPDDFVTTLQQMASMRNRLVHLYSEVDDSIVFVALITAPDDCERFIQLILDYSQFKDE